MLTWTAQSLSSLIELFFAALTLYLIPGYAVLRWMWPSTLRPLSAAQRFALAIGVSLALPPLLLFGFQLIGLKWSAAATWVYVSAAALSLVTSTLYRIIRGTRMTLSWRTAWRAAFAFRWDLVLLVVLTVIATIVRLFSVRELRAGLFGDSYHHTMIVQLLKDNGGLFSSWQPYAPLATFSYHFGFHANTAFYSWLTGTPATLSVVVVGQLMNAFSAPLAFLLTSRVIGAGSAPSTKTAKTAWSIAAIAGIWAAVLTGFVNLMPAYFVNWGRYTQLAGQLLLPVVVVCWIELFERALRSKLRAQAGHALLTTLVTVSLMLTHYIVTLFAALMVATYLLALILREAKWRSALQLLTPAATSAALALLIAAPWIRNTFNSGLVRNTTGFVSGQVTADRVATYAALIPITPSYLKGWMIALAAVGLFIALAQRHWRAALFAVWSVLIVFTVTPQTLGLPGTGIVDQLTAYIALYLTVLPLTGFALAMIGDWFVGKLARINVAFARATPFVAIFSAAMLALSLWGATWLPNVVEPGRQLLTPADERAMQWIRDNVPTNARFVVNTFPAYGGSLVAGTDGGWWIPLLTGRRTNLPPITYGSERAEQDVFYANTNRLAAALRGRPLQDSTALRIDLTTPANVQQLRDAQITHVYSGANAIPGPEGADWIDTTLLRESSKFKLAYDQDGVEIFELLGSSR